MLGRVYQSRRHANERKYQNGDARQLQLVGSDVALPHLQRQFELHVRVLVREYLLEFQYAEQAEVQQGRIGQRGR